MTALRPIAILAVVALGGGAASATAVAAPRDELVKRNVQVRNVPLQGVPGKRYGAGANLAFPKLWRLTRRTASSFTLREGNRSCQYNIRATVRVATGDEATAAEHAAAVVPGAGRFLVDSGSRGSMAWRVVRISEADHVHLEGIAAVPLGFPSQQAGRKLWLETRVSARSDRGDECHAGTWRDTAGPRIGDALATQRARAFLTP